MAFKDTVNAKRREILSGMLNKETSGSGQKKSGSKLEEVISGLTKKIVSEQPKGDAAKVPAEQPAQNAQSSGDGLGAIMDSIEALAKSFADLKASQKQEREQQQPAGKLDFKSELTKRGFPEENHELVLAVAAKRGLDVESNPGALDEIKRSHPLLTRGMQYPSTGGGNGAPPEDTKGLTLDQRGERLREALAKL